MIVRAIDGRYLGHPFFVSIEKERQWQLLLPASKFKQSSRQSFWISKHEMVAGELNCKLFSACTHKRVSSSGALCVGARRSLCRARRSLAVSVFGARRARCVGPRALCRCVGPRRSLCRGPALSMSGPALCVSVSMSGPALSVSSPALSVKICVGAQQSSPGALCVVAQQAPGALCRGPALSVSGPALSVSGPGALSDAVSASSLGPALSRRHAHLSWPDGWHADRSWLADGWHIRAGSPRALLACRTHDHDFHIVDGYDQCAASFRNAPIVSAMLQSLLIVDVCRRTCVVGGCGQCECPHCTACGAERAPSRRARTVPAFQDRRRTAARSCSAGQTGRICCMSHFCAN